VERSAACLAVAVSGKAAPGGVGVTPVASRETPGQQATLLPFRFLRSRCARCVERIHEADALCASRSDSIDRGRQRHGNTRAYGAPRPHRQEQDHEGVAAGPGRVGSRGEQPATSTTAVASWQEPILRRGASAGDRGAVPASEPSRPGVVNAQRDLAGTGLPLSAVADSRASVPALLLAPRPRCRRWQRFESLSVDSGLWTPMPLRGPVGPVDGRGAKGLSAEALSLSSVWWAAGGLLERAE
jgi:hypothetical protein